MRVDMQANIMYVISKNILKRGLWADAGLGRRHVHKQQVADN